MDIVIKNTINPQDFLNIRKENDWKDLPYDLVERAIANSMINVSVYDGEKCMGIGRIVGDGVLKGMLTDIMVYKEYQGKGVGKTIVTTLLKELTDMVRDGETFQLEASPTANNREFYIKCGMKYKPEIQDGVYLWIKK